MSKSVGRERDTIVYKPNGEANPRPEPAPHHLRFDLPDSYDKSMKLSKNQ
jgi:hypothetical protein